MLTVLVIASALLVIFLRLRGSKVASPGRSLPVTCAVVTGSPVRYTHRAIPPMVTEEELAVFETPTFLRTRKAVKKNLQGVHSGKASCLSEMEKLVAEPTVEAKQVGTAKGSSRRKSRQKKQEGTVALQEVSVSGAEACLLLPQTPISF